MCGVFSQRGMIIIRRKTSTGPGICGTGSWRALHWGHWREKRPRSTNLKGVCAPRRLGSSRGDGLAPSSSGLCTSTPVLCPSCPNYFLPLFSPPSPSALSTPTPQPTCLHGASRGHRLRWAGVPREPRGRGLGSHLRLPRRRAGVIKTGASPERGED